MGSDAPYRIELAPSACGDLRKLPDGVKRRIAPKIDALALNPRPPGVKQIRGGDGALRIRVGDYRVIYDVDDADRGVLVRYIRHRREAYR